MHHIPGAEFREIRNVDYLGKPAIVAVATRRYATTVEDLWEAVTTPERLVRWFLPVEGDLHVGGRYQLVGNASGTIERCERPEALDVTWEFAGGVSWVQVRIAADGEHARLTLEHISHLDSIGEEHRKTYGPGAVGIGWDLALLGLAQHLRTREAVDPAAFAAWTVSDEGKAYVRASGTGWADADAAAGEDPVEASAKAERTIAFYTGG